jgi:hypothetical protein
MTQAPRRARRGVERSAHGGGPTQTPPLQTCDPAQQLLQPQMRVPGAQSETQVPKLHTWPQAQPVGHDAGAQNRWAVSTVSRVQTRPSMQRPTHWPPQPSLAPHSASGAQRGTQTQRPVVALQVWLVAAQRVPVPQAGPPAQTLAMETPQSTVAGAVLGQAGMHRHAPPLHAWPLGQRVPVPHAGPPAQVFGIDAPQS